MHKFQNHIEMLEAIEGLRNKLPAVADSHIGQTELLKTLASMYACLDISELKQIVKDFKNMDRRSKLRKPAQLLLEYKKAA